MSTTPVHRFVVVEGPIGVGKTSLARRLAQSFGSELILEQTEENPFLERFYRNPRTAAFPTQLFFLFQRARQLQEFRQQDLFDPVRVADYLLDKDRLFARVTLDDEEYALYEQVYAKLAIDAPKPGPGDLPASAGRCAHGTCRAPRHPLRAAHRAQLPRAYRRHLRALLSALRCGAVCSS